jgi:hypothetical protein
MIDNRNLYPTNDWENLDDNHMRCKTFGGWLVKALDEVPMDYGRGMTTGYGHNRIALAFIPDPTHKWTIVADPVVKRSTQETMCNDCDSTWTQEGGCKCL